MGNITVYEHHGFMVVVDEELKGKHRQHCLCFRCEYFVPNQKINCQIAQRLFKICQKFGLVTPVYECSMFHSGQPDLSKLS